MMSRSRAWNSGLALVREGAYWEAHEELEDVWRAADDGAARDATQALIQFAAAAYKIDQAREGRAAESMQRGMEKLIQSALALVAGAREEEVGWHVHALEDALRELDSVRVRWRDEGDASVAAEDASEVAIRLVDAIGDGDTQTER